jgi:hypothetical protein
MTQRNHALDLSNAWADISRALVSAKKMKKKTTRGRWSGDGRSVCLPRKLDEVVRVLDNSKVQYNTLQSNVDYFSLKS